MLKHQTSYVWERISKIFKDMVTSLKDLPRPDKARGVRGKTTLWEVDEKEKFVVKAEQTLEQIVHDACVQLDASVHLYDEFLPLLTEDLRVKIFSDEEEHSREEYLSEVKRLQTMEHKIRACPNLLRTNLGFVDVSGAFAASRLWLPNSAAYYDKFPTIKLSQTVLVRLGAEVSQCAPHSHVARVKRPQAEQIASGRDGREHRSNVCLATGI